MDKETFYLHWRAFNRQMFNPTCLKHRQFDGHIATAKNCGTHWVKYMLSLAIAEHYGLPPPAHIRDDSIVGHTKNRPSHTHIPQIAVTHSHPHYLMCSAFVMNTIRLPRFVVQVRDIRSILVSMYEKTRGEILDKKMHGQNVGFSAYLRGDVTGKTRIEDIWGLILFFNAWGAVIKRNPEKVIPVRYEDLKAGTPATLRVICDHIGLDIPDDILSRAIDSSNKDIMKTRIAKTETEKIVNTQTRNDLDWYSAEDMKFVRKTCEKHLEYDFGYKY